MKPYIFRGLSFFKILELVFFGPYIYIFLTLYFLVFIFLKDLMKVLYFAKTFFWYFLCDPSFYATAQKFRLLDYIITLHETILGITSKGLVFVLNKGHFLLVRLVWERQMPVIITRNNEYLNNIFFPTFWNQTLLYRYYLHLPQFIKTYSF